MVKQDRCGRIHRVKFLATVLSAMTVLWQLWLPLAGPPVLPADNSGVEASHLLYEDSWKRRMEPSFGTHVYG